MKTTLLATQMSKLMLAALSLAITCGCNAVITRRPVGEKPLKIVAKDWEGEWVTTDGSVKLKVVDADKGLLKAFWIEDDDKGKPMMKTADIELRESADWTFASTKDDNLQGSRGYVWGRIKNEDRQILLWTPDEKAFVQLVKSGVFPGKIDGGDVILDELKSEHLKIIMSGERGVLFQWDKPAVLVKVGK